MSPLWHSLVGSSRTDWRRSLSLAISGSRTCWWVYCDGGDDGLPDAHFAVTATNRALLGGVHWQRPARPPPPGRHLASVLWSD
jgi:hypothetical protein